MVTVERCQEWFLITNGKGGHGRFTLSADSDFLYVYDVSGRNIFEDIYRYVRETSKRMRLKGVKAQIDNSIVAKILMLKLRSDSTVSYDPETRMVTGLNNGQ